MKLIKFNLPLNGTSISTLEELQKNFTAEVLDHFHSGKLGKWLRVRNLTEQAEKVERLLEENNNREIRLFEELNNVFGIELNEFAAKQILAERKKMLPSTQKNVDDEIQIIVADFYKKEIEQQQIIDKTQEDLELVAQAWDERESVNRAEIKELFNAITKINSKHIELSTSIFSVYKTSIKNEQVPTNIANLMQSSLASTKEINSIRDQFLSKFNDSLNS